MAFQGSFIMPPSDIQSTDAHADHVETELTASQTVLLADTLAITQEMLASAQQDDWNAVADLEMRRRESLQLCFQSAVAESESEAIAEALAVILHLNEELLNLLNLARDKSLEDARSSSKSHRAATEYRGVETIR